MASLEFDYVAAIAEHADGFASIAARADLDAPVEHCPGWTVADLIQHMIDVHWFWATITEERLAAAPDESRKPPPVPRDQLVERFRHGATHLTSVLRAANGQDTVWTWAPAQHNIDFISRHQVQEMAIHHWDIAHATGGTVTIAAVVGADSIEEFLTFSISNGSYPPPEGKPALGGRFTIRCTDIDAAWTLSDGDAPRTVRFQSPPDADAPAVRATASDFILWLYQRIDLDGTSVPAGLIEQFRGLCYTD